MTPQEIGYNDNKMTPKEKAYNLFKSFGVIIAEKIDVDGFVCNTEQAKQCALIAVDEILWEIIKYADNSKEYVTENAKFWQEVKTEINNL